MTFDPIPGVKVIAFGHKARQGKDTAAQSLIETWPQHVQRFAFSDALYDYCRVLHNMGPKDAPLLQKVGVDVRAQDPETWIRTVYWKLYDRRPRIAVITDCRFQNEAAFVKQLGGICVRLERYNPDGSRYVADDRPADHPSEIDLDNYPWDYTVANQHLGRFQNEIRQIAFLHGMGA